MPSQGKFTCGHKITLKRKFLTVENHFCEITLKTHSWQYTFPCFIIMLNFLYIYLFGGSANPEDTANAICSSIVSLKHSKNIYCVDKPDRTQISTFYSVTEAINKCFFGGEIQKKKKSYYVPYLSLI